jgi:hypothetical protein
MVTIGMNSSHKKLSQPADPQQPPQWQPLDAVLQLATAGLP